MMKCLFSALLTVSFLSYAFSNSTTINSDDFVAYGEDDWVEVLNASDPMHLHLAYSTATMIPKNYLTLKDGAYRFNNNLPTAGSKIGLCKDEKYYNQVSIGYCSGFLVADDLIVTAGHCYQNASNCKHKLWVFEFWTDTNGNSPKSIPESKVYKCSEIISQKYDFGSGAKRDYAIIRLDRKVTDREPLKVRTQGKVEDHQELFVIGNPSGLPTKVADNAKIKTNHSDVYFMANLDTFSGNSGSAVFNRFTGVVEGILVRGASDYSYDVSARCQRVNYLDNDQGRGEGVTRITSAKELVDLL